LPNSREFCFASASSNGEIFLGACWTGKGAEDFDGVDMGIGARAGVGVDLGVGVCVSVGPGVGVSIGVGVLVGNGAGVAVGVGDGVDDRDSVGDGCSTNGSSVDSVSVTLVDCSFDAADGVRLAVDPGSDQPPTWLPSTKVVCNRV
jgi:hypothetical protein